jgi:general stress protein 26
MSDSTPIEHVRAIMEATRIAGFTHLDDQGRLVCVPMGTQRFSEPGTTHWITEKDSDKVRHLQADPRVNLFYASKEGYVSIAGTARLVEDRDRLAELWGFFTDSFMDGGPEHPNAGLIEVTAQTASWWTTPNGAVTLVKLVAARVGQGETDLGDSGTVSL